MLIHSLQPLIQPLLQFLSTFTAQIQAIYNTIMAIMISISSIVTQTIFSYGHAYIQQMMSGLPAATPKPVSDARTALINFYRALAEPTLCKIKDRCRKWLRNRKEDSIK